MALENSNCVDYVTEKFWDSLYYYEAVPIVIKREYYRNYGVLPSIFVEISVFYRFPTLLTLLLKILII